MMTTSTAYSSSVTAFHGTEGTTAVATILSRRPRIIHPCQSLCVRRILSHIVPVFIAARCCCSTEPCFSRFFVVVAPSSPRSSCVIASSLLFFVKAQRTARALLFFHRWKLNRSRLRAFSAPAAIPEDAMIQFIRSLLSQVFLSSDVS